jgi:twinkle protein
MTPSELKDRLAQRVDTVAAYLLPNGKREGHEWRAGDVNGASGKSLGVHLSGEKAGVWRDFSADEGGDLLDLWCAVKGCDLKTAMDDAKDWLGIREPKLSEPARKKTFKRPERSVSIKKPQPTSPVMDYLRSRGLADETIQAFRVAEDGRNIVFPYLRGSDLVFMKWLGLDRQDGKKKIRASADSEPCLFGWQAIPDAARTVTITEGEIDAMSASQSGYPALSVPFGGGEGEKQRWIEYEFDNLDRFDMIYLALDSDEQGRSATREIIKRLGRERCSIVELPSKDWNDVLTAMIPDEDIERCYKNAKSLDPEKLLSVDAFRDDVQAEFANPVETAGMPLPWDKARDLLRFRPTETTVWTGWNGHGKSQLLGFIALTGMVKEGERFCIASMEMPAKRTLSRIVRQAAGSNAPAHGYIDGILDALTGKLWIYDQMGSADIEEMLAAFKYAAKRYNVTHFIVDSLAKCGLGEEDYDAQKRAIDRLTSFAHEMEVHVHLVAHPRKGMDEDRPPNKLDVRGGAALTDMADNVVTVWRNKPKEKEAEKLHLGEDIEPKYQDQGDVRMIVSKQRATGGEGSVALWFDPMSNQYLGKSTHRPNPIVSWSNRQEVAA